MNIFKILLFTLLITPIHATGAVDDIKLDLSLFAANEDRFHGVAIALSGGSKILYKGDIIISPNLGGIGIAIGYKFNNFKTYIGYEDVIRMDKISGLVPIHGVDVLDPEGDGKGSAFFVEVRYKRLFLRHNWYDVDYNHHADLTIVNPNPPPKHINASSSIKTSVEDSVTWAGFIIPFN